MPIANRAWNGISREALNSGSTRDEIIEAIGVTIEMGGGPATVASRFAMNVLEYYFNK